MERCTDIVIRAVGSKNVVLMLIVYDDERVTQGSY